MTTSPGRRRSSWTCTSAPGTARSRRRRDACATLVAGTVALWAEDQEFQLLERDALRFAADRPYRFENMTNSTARLLLCYQYLK